MSPSRPHMSVDEFRKRAVAIFKEYFEHGDTKDVLVSEGREGVSGVCILPVLSTLSTYIHFLSVNCDLLKLQLLQLWLI